jgi:D-alanine-D-alanine ligase
MKILVLGGGTSNERSVSLKSAKAVIGVLMDLGHEVNFVDPADGESGVIAAVDHCDVVFPLLHGIGGENGEIQALLDHLGKPYLGSGVTASQRAFDKVTLKELLIENALPTAPYQVVSAQTLNHSHLITRPFVLKPILGGSSIDIAIERHLPDTIPSFRRLFEHHHEMLLEELIEGVELTVAVLGDRVLPVIEIIPPHGKEFDYENKYNGKTVEFCPAVHISYEVQDEARRLALLVHELIGARHLSRTDMIAQPDGSLMILEINTMPGMTEQSLFPKAAAAAGLDWNKLVEELLKLSITT